MTTIPQTAQITAPSCGQDLTQGSADGSRRVAIAVVGAGPVGLTAGLILARRLASVSTDGRAPGVAVIAPPPLTGDNVRDLRTTATFHQGIALLREAGVDESLIDGAAELAGIRMIDVSDRMLRAPDVLFRADEIDLEAFGYNLPNSDTVAALEAAAAGAPQYDAMFERVFAAVEETTVADQHVTLRLDTGETVLADCVIAADGRHSRLRAAAEISTRQWDHDQAAITSRFAHSRPHNNISTELHTRGGPCTTVPLPGNASSLVWMETTDRVTALTGAAPGETPDVAHFTDELQARVRDHLGRISDVVAPKSVPLLSLVANRFAARRIFLIGEAAHAFPPIGAQGLNLGFRDIVDAVEAIVDAVVSGEDPGGQRAMATYHRKRVIDVEARSRAVDALNVSLTANLPFMPLARGAGLHAVRAVPFLRRALMRQGMSGLPALPFVFGGGQSRVRQRQLS